MSKKIVRGITDIKTISNQDLDTNNVNDLLSDGKHNYIHRKKQDGTEEYHNLTNNLKTIQSDDTDLVSVTNYNNTTNSATIRPKHDAQKEQVLESTDNTIVITHGENGTDETTTVDVNPAKVLTHDNLESTNGTILISHGENGTSVDVNPKKVLTYDNLDMGYGIYKVKQGNNIKLGVTHTSIDRPFDLNNFNIGYAKSDDFINAPKANTFFFVSACSDGNYIFQEAVEENDKNTTYRRTRDQHNVWGEWREQCGDKELYSGKESYSHANATLKTFFKTVGNEEEFNFLAKMNKSQTSADFTLNAHDTAVFQYLIDTYGLDNKINVCGSAFTLNGSNLNFNSNGSTYNPHIITFTDIIPTSAIDVTQ